MTVEKRKPKRLLRPITTGADSTMNQSQFLANTCNSLEAREKWRVHGDDDGFLKIFKNSTLVVKYIWIYKYTLNIKKIQKSYIWP